MVSTPTDCAVWRQGPGSGLTQHAAKRGAFKRADRYNDQATKPCRIHSTATASLLLLALHLEALPQQCHGRRSTMALTAATRRGCCTTVIRIACLAASAAAVGRKEARRIHALADTATTTGLKC